MSKAADLAALIGSQTALSHRNMVINGAMNVAQRSTSETGLGATAGYHTIDRFRTHFVDTAGRVTMAQVADVHDGFANALKFTCTTADTSIAATEQFKLEYRIEGQDLQQLKKGASDAEKVTVSFYVKGDANATYVCELLDVDNSRSNTQAFNVTSSWNRISLTFAGDTTGSLDDDNARSLDLIIWLHAGSNFTSGTFASNTWGSTTNANRYAGSRTSFFDSTDRTFFITGVQMELGEQATPFEHRSFADDLVRCQRYHQRHTSGVTNARVGFGAKTSATNARCILPFNTPMRSTPSHSITGTPRFETGAAAQNVSSINTSGANNQCGSFDATTASGGAQNDPGVLDCGDGGYIFDSEL